MPKEQKGDKIQWDLYSCCHVCTRTLGYNTCTKHSFSEGKKKKKKYSAFEHDVPDFLKDSMLDLVTEALTLLWQLFLSCFIKQ